MQCDHTVSKLVHCVVKYSRPPDLKSSSNVSLPFAWITGPATDPSLIQSVNSRTELTLVDFHHLMSQVPKYIAGIQLNSRNLCEIYFFPLFLLHSLYYCAFFYAFALYFLLDLSKEILQRGHSTTTWIKLYPILTPTHPLRVDKNGHFTY